MRGTANFCGTKEKRRKNEERILMVKKANAFFYMDLFSSVFSSFLVLVLQ
jgi:hypothetical protein